MAKQKSFYLDNAATTPVDPRVLQAMAPYFNEAFGNASSLHGKGNEAMVAVEASRAKIASFLGCSSENVYFTSGATESDNWAILGLTRAILRDNSGFKPHIIISAVEHEAVIEPVRRLVKDGLAESTYLKVDKNGLVSPEDLKKSIKANTVLVSVMLANNEIGSIQPLTKLAQVIAEANSSRKRRILFHTDATQAPAYVECNVKKLGVDLMSLSAHKIYGPKGVGALYVGSGIKLEPLVYGGGQQQGARSGTYNVAEIVGFGKAVEIVSDKKERSEDIKRIKELRDYLVKQVLVKVPRSSLNGSLKDRLPNNASFIFPGVEGESVVLMLSRHGICASTGSACSSGSLEPSHVLLAIGVPIEHAHGSLRLTLGRFTKKSDIEALLKHLPSTIEKLRQMSPLKN
ncbi:MAG: Cysteine desulfurase [Parcubacteria group bacterium ADurb.Bin326]|nr:MAG: Cysteine desulfurase [Parcubacteria group bacterium ADurb.Bin326]